MAPEWDPVGMFLGALAYVASIAAVWYHLPARAVADLGIERSMHDVAIWYHYSANWVEIVEKFGPDAGQTVAGVNLIAASNNPELEILYLFPVVALAIAGGVGQLTIGSTLGSAMTVAIGYTGVMTIGAYAFSIRASGLGMQARVGPSFGSSFLHAFGIGLAAALAGALLFGIVAKIFR